MKQLQRPLLAFALWLVTVPLAVGQTPIYRAELLPLLPDDFAVCVVLNDFRGHSARWEQSDWLKRFRLAPVGKSLLEAPELKQIEHWQRDLKKHLDLDWRTLRDDILGDALVLGYTPGPKGRADDENGIFLLHCRKPERLFAAIEKLNDAQRRSGEVKSVEPRTYQGETYVRREQGNRQQYYLLKDSLFVFTVKEASMHAVVDRRLSKKVSPWAKRFEQAGADRSLVTLCVNPRVLDAEIATPGKKNDPLPAYWRALDAIFVIASIRDEAEVRITIQADADKLPKWARPAFEHTIPATDLWQRFPESSAFTIASVTNFAGTVDALKLLVPENDRAQLTKDWSKIGALLGLDPFKDLLPNLGPDWGICMLPGADAQQLPQVLIAVAVKPGMGEKPVDQELFKSIDTLAKIAAFQTDGAIRLQSLKQGAVEVKYLASETFPAGFQPAAALKDGYLLFATSPAPIAEFRLRGRPAEESRESTLVRISTVELAKMLEQRRSHVLSTLTERKQMTPAQAQQNLENVTSFLRLFEHVTLNQQGGAGQTTWILRLTPR